MFSASDALRHTGLATTEPRRRLWATSANRVYEATGDEAKAIRLANSAVFNSVNVACTRRAQR